MASKSETGHPINVANFEQIVLDVASYDGQYNPSNESLKVNALRNLLAEAKNAINEVTAVEPAYRLAVGSRDEAFSPLRNLVTKIINALKASGVSTQVVDSAQTLTRKLQGRRATSKMSDEEKKLAESEGQSTKEASSSQLSYDNQIENFDRLIQFLNSVPSYKPNEPNLQTVTLSNLLADLKAKNLAALNAEIPLTNARIKRNDILYTVNTGLVDVALNVKTYIKSVFGTSSPQYKKISKIKFTKPR